MSVQEDSSESDAEHSAPSGRLLALGWLPAPHNRPGRVQAACSRTAECPAAGPTPALHGAPPGRSAGCRSAHGGQMPTVFGQMPSTRFSFFRDQRVPAGTSQNVLCPSLRPNLSWGCDFPPVGRSQGRYRKPPETLPRCPGRSVLPCLPHHRHPPPFLRTAALSREVAAPLWNSGVQWGHSHRAHGSYSYPTMPPPRPLHLLSPGASPSPFPWAPVSLASSN